MMKTPRRQHSAPLTAAAVSALLAIAIVIGPASSAPGHAAAGATGAYEPLGPSRLADTREDPCGCTRLDQQTIHVDIAGRTGVPDGITAVALTITATASPQAGHVTVFPSGETPPHVSMLNLRPDRVVANSAIVPVGADGSVSIFHLVPVDLIVDVTGVFVATERSRAGRFVPLPSDRLIDLRTPADGAAPLPPGGEVTVPLPAGVATDATAIVVNVTSVGESEPGHLSVRPAGTSPGTTSFLNPSGTGQPIAASVVAPVSASGFTIRSFGGGFLIVDVVGWFTGPSADESIDGLFRPEPPRRLLDTRDEGYRIHPGGTIELDVEHADTAALVTNVTVTQADRSGWVVAYPAGTTRPPTSTANPAFFGHTVANLAITTISTRGIAYRSHAGADVVVDVTGSFTGRPAPAALPPQPNDPTRSRVLIVGDSTLAGVDLYDASKVALRGFDAIVDAESCRRLLRPSCFSNVTLRTPNTAVEAIEGTPGTLDIVVVKAGFNDWFSDFPREFDAVVAASRSKGAHTILWMTQNEAIRPGRRRTAYEENNVDIRWLTPLPQYSDVIMADWQAYSDPRQDWFEDGTHVTRDGAYAITDYVARWIAALEHRPCPRPLVVGGAIPDPCPIPDQVGAIPDPRAVAG
ncbi:MAG: hypothetical protein HKN41_13805 [Ilumatobacter sp.]|nr:hypothetical protein [Ilumatobacter sp.]